MTHPLPFGHVTLAGAGPGAVGHLTLAVARALEGADIVLHDKLVSAEVLALAGPQATLVETGKEGFGPSMAQSHIETLMVGFAQAGRNVLRLKSGDPGLFGRLGEELDALDAAGIAYTVLPGITAAAAAAASLNQSLTERGRNREFRLLTGHGADGFAEADWASLARPGTVAAIYMGKKAARFIQGRLMMHGGCPTTPVTLVENASRAEERRLSGTLADLPALAAQLDGPAVILWGLAPRAAETAEILEAAQ
ncbi:uroporphyrinogen-III C-methyltransferase [Rhodobacter aestuarii]|uniref:uroporphyrinogen-III C-methyltransferase n=1 Tax=Rhodobacter aestuarii TaxID=453582 RepID=A0A1N7P818_9RHOB|nr:uroporphyrinogen-III C-methyltransferase [Rhodobacter aestuarii]PTV97649.1 uroporphyrinogen-III C-methyltransferase [Rhodobacter aestuarii]SIT06676.1 uroporphyrinogen-III C-methyltransferase [Rhodobacter aestuarii]